MKVALKFGLSHVPLANAALDALEDWSSNIPFETMQPCYSSVLPLLDGYLKAHTNNSKRIIMKFEHSFLLVNMNLF